jgi:hypothetical protein
MAYWGNIESLYVESRMELFSTARLSHKAVFPTTIERQNVSLCLRVFSDSTVAALRARKYADTALFVETVLQFWRVCTVKCKGLDQRHCCKFLAAVDKADPWQLNFLTKFASMVRKMRPANTRNRSKSLTRDTADALYNTCNGLCALANFLFSSGFAYVTLGSFNNDPLESQFGQFRQSAGGSYSLTARSIVQRYRIDKVRLLLTINPCAMSAAVGADPHHFCNVCGNVDPKLVELLPLLAEDLTDDAKETLVFVAGYVAKEVSYDSSEDTTDEFTKHRAYFDEINRQSLCVPPDPLVLFLYYATVSFLCISHNCIPCKKSILMLCEGINDVFSLFDRSYEDSVFRIATNILFNNFTHQRVVPDKKAQAIKLMKFAE